MKRILHLRRESTVMKSANVTRHLPGASYYTITTIMLMIIISTVKGSPTANFSSPGTTVKNNTAVSTSSLDASVPGYSILVNGTVLRFSTKPPLYDVRRVGVTSWYQCLAEVIRSANHISGLGQPEDAEVVTKWLVPEGVPRFNYSGKGDWPDLKGHGYFVIHADSANQTLVLIHPEMSDTGKYVCQAQVGNVHIHAKMELYVVSTESYLKSTGYGFLAVILFVGALGLLCLLNRLVIGPYCIRKRIKERGSANIQQSYIEDHDHPVTDEVQPSLSEEKA